jgi:hypothetical protein
MVIMRAGWSNVTVATLLGVDNVGLFFLSTHGKVRRRCLESSRLQEVCRSAITSVRTP